MGTRHLIGATLNGETKLAQYGQWDGYPSGQGRMVLSYLRGLVEDPTRFATFLKNLDKCRELTKEEIDTVNDVMSNSRVSLGDRFPELSRDTSSGVLLMIEQNPLGLVFDETFGKDSLFCEWAWWIDFDLGMFEVYQGFQRKDRDIWHKNRFGDPLPDDPKDKYVPGTSDYWPVKLVQAWPLDDLPTVEEFLALLEPPIEEEEEE